MLSRFLHLWLCLGVLSALVVITSGCGPTTLVIGITPGDQAITETRVHQTPGSYGRKVAIVDVSGLIINARRPGLLSEGEHPVSRFSEMLERAAGDARVHAVILRMNTPGGSVTASDAMYREVKRFRATTHKPVVALMMDVAASGGYYVACATDEVVAYPTAITGSIGVVMQTLTFEQALNRLGIQTVTIKSGSMKAAGSPLEHLTAAQREVFEDLIMQFYQRFLNVVRERRPDLDIETLALVGDGRIVSGQSAYEMGLVDHIGDLYTAFARARALAGLERADLVVYHRPLQHVGSPYAGPATGGGAEMTQINLMQLNLDRGPLSGDMNAGFYYLWWPELP